MKRFLISSAVAATVLATSGMAKIATDGTGQFLVAPAYYADGKFETELKLVNTDLLHSVLYRGVIREFEASQEVDFIVALSPSDVWEAKIAMGKDGKVYLTSDDDSNYEENLNVNLSDAQQTAGNASRSFKRGYVEFYPIASFEETNIEVPGISKIISKPELAGRFRLLAGVDKYGYPLPNWTFSTKNTTPEALPVGNDMVAGYATMVAKETNKEAIMTIPMTAFENVGHNPVVRPAPAGDDTTQTDYLTEAGIDSIYGDLSKTTVTVPYDLNGKNDGLYFTFWGDYAGKTQTGCTQKRTYDVIGRDMKEGRPGVTTPKIERRPIISPRPKVITVATPESYLACEMTSMVVNDALDKELGMGDVKKYKKGMFQINNIKTHTGDQRIEPAITSAGKAAFLATQISARVDDAGNYSFSWTYAPTK